MKLIACSLALAILADPVTGEQLQEKMNLRRKLGRDGIVGAEPNTNFGNPTPKPAPPVPTQAPTPVPTPSPTPAPVAPTNAPVEPSSSPTFPPTSPPTYPPTTLAPTTDKASTTPAPMG